MSIRAGFDTFSGYGNDAVDMCVALSRLGIDVVPEPTSLRSGLPAEFLQLLRKDPRGQYDVGLQFAPPHLIEGDWYGRSARTSVGWSMWERSLLVGSDFKEGPRFDGLDLMVVTCHENVDAFAPVLPEGMPVAVVPNGIDPELFPVVEHGTGGPMVFASVGMLAGRKDPFTTLAAWELAQELEPRFDARLVLKTSMVGLHPGLMERYRNVLVISEEWEREKLVRFYDEVDVLVSTSRGEGNNKPAMEFMATGGPVMATETGGHLNWLHPEWAYPLPGDMVQAEGAAPGVKEFRAHIRAVAETFIHCWAHPEEVRAKGEAAAVYVRADLTWEKVCSRLLLAIGRVM